MNDSNYTPSWKENERSECPIYDMFDAKYDSLRGHSRWQWCKEKLREEFLRPNGKVDNTGKRQKRNGRNT